MSNAVHRKVIQARRILNIRHGISLCVWSTSIALWGAGILLLAGRLFGWNVTAAQSVLAGLVAGIGSGVAVAIWTSPSSLTAAVELDRLFHLEERVSTYLSLTEEQRQAPAGVALAADVERRVANLNVADRFTIQLPRSAWLAPVSAAAIVILATLVGPLEWAAPASAAPVSEAEKERIAEETKVLSKKLAERKKEAAENQLGEKLEELTEKIDNATKAVAKSNAGVKDAVVKLNDLAKTIEEERKKLDAVDQVRRGLAKLPTMADGPAKELAKALKKGDFADAKKQLEQMQKQLQDKTMDAEQKKKLGEQLEQLKKQLEQQANLAERAKQLKDTLPADMLKEELQKLAQDAQKMQQLQELAQKLGECSKCMNDGEKSGEMKQAIDQAKAMLDQMKRDSETQKMMDEMMQDLAECRGGMCRGEGEGAKDGNGNGDGLGRGRGQGDRPEAEDKVRSQKKHDPGQVTKGKVYVIGQAEGNNFKGDSILEIREAAAQAARAEEDAVARQKIPREYKKHTQDYFDQLNGQLNQQK